MMWNSMRREFPKTLRIPYSLEMKWQPTPVFLPGKPHGQRNLAGHSPWGLKIVRHNLATKQQQIALYSYFFTLFLKVIFVH